MFLNRNFKASFHQGFAMFLLVWAGSISAWSYVYKHVHFALYIHCTLYTYSTKFYYNTLKPGSIKVGYEKWKIQENVGVELAKQKSVYCTYRGVSASHYSGNVHTPTLVYYLC